MLASMTDAQIEYYARHLPLVEARKHLPLAQLTADVREVMMPRYTEPDPDEPKPSRPPRARKPWTALELLPFYASFGEPERMTPEEAQALIEHLDELPSWARAVAPADEARDVLASQ